MPNLIKLFYCSLFIAVTSTGVAAENRTIDGTQNNLLIPDRGSSHQPIVRISYPNFSGDRAFVPPEQIPNPRDVSNRISNQTTNIPNARGLSDYAWVWGQFLAHDLGLTTTSHGVEVNGESPILISDQNDALSPGPINFVRSNFSIEPGNNLEISPFPCHDCREQINETTSYIDASMVYGSTDARAAALRTNAGLGAHLLTSGGNLLPYNTLQLPNENNGPFPAEQLFVAGDIRSNENPLLSSMHTLFVREHNRLVDTIQNQQPNLDDEETFQLARKIVGAQIQAITYNEFLPAMMGDFAPKAHDYRYDSKVNASATQSFSHAINRWGHTAISPNLQLIDELGGLTGKIPLRDAFFNPTILSEDSGLVEQFLRGAASQVSQEIDVYLVDDVRNFLFGPAGSGGLDLAALNIQRGRDHGLPPYFFLQLFYENDVAPRLNFDDMTSDQTIADALRELYDSPVTVDAWVGALAEDHLPGSSFGQLTTTITQNQFERLRDGDRLFYLSEEAGLFANGKLLPEIESMIDLNSIRLSDVIRANTSITNLQEDVFFADLFPESTVPGDYDKNRILDSADIDMLSTEIMLGEGDMSFDLNADFTINGADHRIWIEDLKKTWYGDSNLDGEFNSSDLTIAFQAGEFEDALVRNSTWQTGDWNGDMEFDSSDLVAAFQESGFERGQRMPANAVPEPHGGSFYLFSLMCVAFGRTNAIRNANRKGRNRTAANSKM